LAIVPYSFPGRGADSKAGQRGAVKPAGRGEGGRSVQDRESLRFRRTASKDCREYVDGSWNAEGPLSHRVSEW
jgi:hypothetical protein